MDEKLNIEISATTEIHREKSPYDFVIALNSNVAASNGLKKDVVVSRAINDQENSDQNKKSDLRIYGKLIIDNSLQNDQICMDQTLRNALGIPFESSNHKRSDLSISPLRRSFFQSIRSKLASALGSRYIFLRVAKPYPPDIEKNICRVPKDALNLIGTDPDNKVVILSCNKSSSEEKGYQLLRHSIKAFEYDSNLNNQRQKDKYDQTGKGWSARYVNASKLLGVDSDIDEIMLDRHDREKLKVQPGDPVKIRRDFPDLLKRQLLEVGVLLALSPVALSRLFREDFKTENYGIFLGITLGVSFVFAIGIILFRLRARVK